MKILKVEIKDFQSHKNTNIEFSEGFNCIIGRSDSGKSAILRALRLVICNDLRGTFFVSKNSSSNNSYVKITFDNGVEIERIKGVDNIYKITKNNNTEQFSRFGDTIPTIIRENLPEYTLNLGDYNINLMFANQFDKFIVTETSTVKTKFINSLSGSLMLTLMRKDLESDSLKLSGEINKINTELSKYKEIDKLVKLIKVLKAKLDSYNSVRSILDKLKDVYQVYKNILDKLKRKERINSSVNKETVVNLTRTIENILLYYKFRNISDEYQAKKFLLDKIKSYKVVNTFETLEKLKQIKEKYSLIIEQEDSKRKELANFKKEKNKLSNKLKSLIRDLKICPICNREITDDVAVAVIHEIN